jgi:tetratricopeptide (TPR) repeat protein
MRATTLMPTANEYEKLNSRQSQHQRQNLLLGAIALHRNGQLPEAAQQCRQMLQAEPDQADALHLMGIIAYQQGHHHQAVEFISKAIENKPADPMFHNNLGLALEALDLESEAKLEYEKAIQMDARYADAHNNLGNVLLKEGQLDAARHHFQQAIKLEPRMPQAHLNLGKMLVDKGDIEAAIGHYQEAIELDPDYAKAYNNLGNALREQGQIDAAIDNFRRAVRIRPNYVGALNNLGNALRACGRLDKAVETFSQAVKLAPNTADSYCNLGNVFKDSGQYEKALSHYKHAIRLRSGFAEAHFNCAMVYLLTENFEEGWQAYEWRLQKQEWKTLCPHRANLPLWNGESFVGKSLLVYDEQGFGDTIQFVRYLPLVKSKGGRVIFETRRQLIKLFANLPGADEVVERIFYDTPAIKADRYIPLCSLPGIFKTRLETIPANIPYLHPNPEKEEQWRHRFSAGGVKVGLVWQGSSVDPNRSIDPALFSPLTDRQDISLYGLQKDAAQSESMLADMQILNLGDDLNDFADTAGAIANLDLVISIDTSVAHLAGALGKAVWVLLPYVADWRWFLERTDSPWYPTMRLFRQRIRGDWQEVIQRVTRQCHAWLAANTDKPARYPAARPAEYHYRCGNHHYDSNDPGKAISAYQKAIELKDDFFEAHFNLARIYQDQQDFKTSISCYQKALNINPQAYQALYNLGVVQLTAGQLDAAADAFQQALDLKPDFPEAYNNLGVVYQKQEKLNPAIECFQKSVEINPAYAEAYHNLGSALYTLKQFAAAEKSYRMALEQNPNYAEAHHNLGLLLHAQGKLDQAAVSYRKTMQLRPADARAYYDMGNIFLDQGNLAEMTHWYQQALAVTPHKAEAYNNLGKMLKDQGSINTAESYFQEAIRLKPNFVDAHFNRSIALLLRGDFIEGWREYEWRFRKRRWKNVYPHRFEQPRWDGTVFKGKKVLVHCEQGLGDAIQFARYLPMVKARGGTVIFETPKPLMNIFRHFPGVDQLLEISSSEKPAVDFDFYVPLMSLPGIFQTTLDSIPAKVPYIKADPHKQAAWQKKVDKDHLNVGIVWAGGILHQKDSSRSCSLKDFLPLTHIAGVQLYGLQKGPASQQVAELSGQIQIENYGEAFKDFSDTAGLIANLDLVVSVDTAVAHLAGAMGKPVWVLLPSLPDWRWMLDRVDSPWYPTMRLFRQKDRGCWDEVLQLVAQELSQRVTR